MLFSQFSSQKKQLYLSLSLTTLAFSLCSIFNVSLFPFLQHEAPTAPITQTLPTQPQLAQVSPEDTTGQVLGIRSPSIYISGGDYSYASGGLLSMSNKAESSVEIQGYNVSGKFTVSLYQANEDALLRYLQYTSEYTQKNKLVSTDGMSLLAQFEREIGNGNNNSFENRLDLPIQNVGLYYLKLQSAQTTVDSFILRSNFGAVAKEGDNEVFVWVQDFDTLKSLSNVSYTTYSLLDGTKQLESGQTNAQGTTTFSVNTPPDLAILKKDGQIALLPLNLQYLSSWGGGSYQSFKTAPRQTKFFTFTDRPLYRPGDTVYFKSIIRDEDDARFSIPSGSIQVTLGKGYDDEEILFRKNYTITNSGTIDGEISLPEELSTGYYTLKIKLDENLISYQYIDVEHFRKPEYTISVEAQKKQIVVQDTIDFQINGSYFSGQPLTNKEVKYTVYGGKYYEYEYAQSDTVLSEDNRYSYWHDQEITSGTATLNEKGIADVSFKSTLPNTGSSQVFSIEVSYEDETGNPSFDRKNILVYDGEYSIYRSPDSFYSHKVNQKASLDLVLRAHQNGTVANVPLTATIEHSEWVKIDDPNQKYPRYEEKKETLSPLSAKTNIKGEAHFEFTPSKTGSYTFTVTGKDQRGNEISRKFYIWVTDRDGVIYSGGNTNSLSLSIDKDVYEPSGTVRATISSALPNRDVLLTFERDRLNRYQIISIEGESTQLTLPLKDTDIPNIFLRATSFADNDFDTQDQKIKLNTNSKRLNVRLTPDRTEYGPGDQVTVNVETTDTKGNPLSADVAVWSVDKAIFELSDSNLGNIFEEFWKERYWGTATTHSLQGIVVNAAERGGCFVSGTPITLANGSTKAIEDVQVGDTLQTRSASNTDQLSTVTVKATHHQTDTGYLVINQTLKVTPNHYLWINQSWQTADNIQIGDLLWSTDGNISVNSIEYVTGKVDVYNLETSGNHTFLADNIWVHNEKGGGGRSVFKDTAYWNPRVRTDGSGRAKVSFKLPDNLTTWVVAGVGATDNTVVGQNTAELKVSKSVVIRPVLPNVLQQDDPMIVEAIVHNFSSQKQTLNTTFEFESGEVWPTEVQKVEIEPNDSKLVQWNVIARQTNEKAKVRFSAKGSSVEFSDSIEQTITVEPFGFEQEITQTGQNDASFPIILNSKIDQDRSSVTLNFASSIVTALPAAVQYLIDYPYGCTEQTTSRFVPTVIAANNPELFAEVLKDKDLNKMIAKGVNRLKEQQQGENGWSWWGKGESDPFISAYVLEYLLKAKAAGYDVDAEMLGSARRYFELIAPTTKQEDKVAVAYALALLNSDKKHAITDFSNLSPDMLSLAVMTNIKLGNRNSATNGLAQLAAMAQAQGQEVYFEASSAKHFGSREASSALAARALMMGNGDKQMISGIMQYLLHHRQSYYWGNTFGTAQTIEAVSQYAKDSQELNPNYSYTITLDGKNIASRKVSSSKTPLKSVNIPLSSIKSDGSSVVEITKTGEGELYSTLINKSFVTDKQTPAIEHEAKITRRYLNSNGDEVIPAVGEYVTVELTVSGLKEDASYAIIHDHLPAGMIPVNITFNNQQAQSTAKYWRYYEGMSDVEYTIDGAILSLYRVKAGDNKFSYKARVVNRGEFTPPPAKFSLMYNPAVYAQTAITTVKIGDESIVIPAKSPVKVRRAPEVPPIAQDWRVVIAAILIFSFFVITFIVNTHKYRLPKVAKAAPTKETDLSTPVKQPKTDDQRES